MAGMLNFVATMEDGRLLYAQMSMMHVCIVKTSESSILMLKYLKVKLPSVVRLPEIYRIKFYA